jgi:hypothetical protein
MSKHLLFFCSSIALLGCGPRPVINADTCDNNTDNAGEVCFETPSILNSPTPLFDAVLFDIDLDTRPDLITASTDGSALIFRGDPNGGFQAFNPANDKIFYNAPTGSKAPRLFLDDLNADGLEDLLFLVEEPGDRGAIYSLLRVNADDFQTSVRSPLSAAPIDGELTIQDAGGSSIVVLQRGSLEIQQGDNGGLFTNPRVQALNSSASRDIVPATLDADDLPDLLLADAFTSAVRLVAIQDGTYVDSGFTLIPPSSWLTITNGDMISSDAGVGSISYLRGLGNGDFEPLSSFFVGDEPRETTVADLDGDGLDDIIVTGGITTTFLRGLGNREFQESNPTWGGADLKRIFVQDLTFDGAADIFSVGALGVTFTEGRLGSLPQGVEIPLGRERPKVAALLDFDLDGDQDIALSINSGLLIAKNNGAGQFNFAAPTVIPLDPTPIALSVGDIDGDSDLDIITLDPQNPIDPNSEGTGRIIVNQGGVFNAQSVLPLSDLPAGTVALLTFDQDNDQKSDLITLGATSAILLSDGQRFVNPQAINASNVTQGVLADIDQDGVLDLLVGQGQDVKIFAGPSFTQEQSLDTTGRADLISAADINQDQLLDLVVLDTETPLLRVFLQQSEGVFSSALTGVVPTGAQGFAVGDFDADQIADVLVVGASLSQVLAFDGQGLVTRTARGAVGLPIGGVAGVLLNQDIDGDNTVDLVLPAQERGLLVSRQKR